jgi:hypothetical protein
VQNLPNSCWKIYDLFHGNEAHQRADLFDEVADCAVSLVIPYRNETGDDDSMVKILKKALDFASGASLREKIIHNLSVGENNLDSKKYEPIFEKLKSLTDTKLNPAQKLNRIKAEVLPFLPSLAPASGQISTAYNALLDSVAISLRAISIDAHNDRNDFATAEVAIHIALKITVSEDLKTRLQEDAEQVRKSVKDSSCHFCGVSGCNEATSLNMAMHGDVQRSYGRVNFRTTTVHIPRCDACKKKHSNADSLGCGLAILALIIGSLIGGSNDGNWFVGGFFGGILGFVFYLIFINIANLFNGYNNFKKYPAIVDLRKKGWAIGDKPS